MGMTDTSDDDGDTVMTMPTNTSSARKKEMMTRKMKKRVTQKRKFKKNMTKVVKVLKKIIAKKIPSVSITAIKRLIRVKKEEEARKAKQWRVKREVASKR